MMKSAVYEGPKQIAMRDVDIPRLGPTDIIVRVRACGICGSDLHSYKDGSYIELGQVMGHEFSGDVVEVGKDKKQPKHSIVTWTSCLAPQYEADDALLAAISF